MIIPETWGFVDEIINEGFFGKRIFIKQNNRSNLCRYKDKDKVIMIGNEDGVLYVETGLDQKNISGNFLQYPERMRIKPGTWHRFTAVRNTFITEFSNCKNSECIDLKSGGIVPDLEFRDILKNFYTDQSSDRVIDIETAKVIADALHLENRTIGMSNGCFDLMHLGHAAFLEEARQRCEVLFVAVNTDDAIKMLKGDKRPYVDQKGRLGMVASNRFVDYVVICDKTTCIEVIDAVKPDIYITTTESGKTSPEARETISKGRVVEVVDMIPQYNTTAIAKNILGK